MRKPLGIALSILLFTAAGCAIPKKPELASTRGHGTTGSTSLIADARAMPRNVSVRITRQEYGSRWPFTVNEGELECRDTGVTVGTTEMKEVVFSANGITYALNGYASSRGGYHDVTEIWADDPALPGARKDIGPIIRRALSLPESPFSQTSVAPPSGAGIQVGSPPAQLASDVRKYNEMLHQTQTLLSKEGVAWHNYLRAMSDWEAIHGEIAEDKPYPRELAKLLSLHDSLLAQRSRYMRDAARLLQVIKADAAFGEYYREREQAIADDEVPGLLIGTDAEHLRFVQRRQHP